MVNRTLALIGACAALGAGAVYIFHRIHHYTKGKH